MAIKELIDYEFLCSAFVFGFFFVVRLGLFLVLFVMDFVVGFDLFVFQCVGGSSCFLIGLSEDFIFGVLLTNWSILDYSLTGTSVPISSSACSRVSSNNPSADFGIAAKVRRERDIFSVDRSTRSMKTVLFSISTCFNWKGPSPIGASLCLGFYHISVKSYKE